MERLISEPIEPEPGAFDTAAMSRGEPGLPPSFTWRGLTVRVLECLKTWKVSRPEPGGELYVRRHYFRIRVDDGSDWTVYRLRKGTRHGWFLYSISGVGDE